MKVRIENKNLVRNFEPFNVRIEINTLEEAIEFRKNLKDVVEEALVPQFDDILIVLKNEFDRQEIK